MPETAATHGLLGGSFDPVHNGHLHLARHARERFGLATVVFLPAGRPPHKPEGCVASAGDRLAMLRLAVDETPAFTVSERELRRDGPSYTVRTLRELAEEEPGATYRLLLGSDMLADLHKWKEAEEVIRLGRPIVATRPGGDLPPDHPAVRTLEPADAAAALREALDPSLHAFVPQLAEGLLDLPPAPVSSTEIRRRIRAGEPLDGLVPGGVAEYIQRHNVYETK